MWGIVTQPAISCFNKYLGGGSIPAGFLLFPLLKFGFRE